MTDPTSSSSGYADWHLPALLSGVIPADLLGHLVTDLVVLRHLVTLAGQLVVAQVSLMGVRVEVMRLADALLSVLDDILTVVPVHLLAVRLVHLVALLPVASLLDSVVLDPAPCLLLVLPVAAVVVAVAQHGAHGAQDNLNNTISETGQNHITIILRVWTQARIDSFLVIETNVSEHLGSGPKPKRVN